MFPGVVTTKKYSSIPISAERKPTTTDIVQFHFKDILSFSCGGVAPKPIIQSTSSKLSQ